MREPNVSSALVGVIRPEQIEENVKASGVTLDIEIIHKIEDILNGIE